MSHMSFTYALKLLGRLASRTPFFDTQAMLWVRLGDVYGHQWNETAI